MKADIAQPLIGGGDEDVAANGIDQVVETIVADIMEVEQESLDTVGQPSDEMEADSEEVGHDGGVQERGRKKVEVDVDVEVVQQVIRKTFKQDSYAVVEKLRRKPVEKSRLCIPLCRLQTMTVVRPALITDIKRLQNAFVYGYRPMSAAMYVAPTNQKGEGLDVTAEIQATWNEHWRAENEKFERILEGDRELTSLCNKMFFVYDGNHRLLAWRDFIETQHKDEASWYSEHGRPECLVLDVSKSRKLVLNAMHDINM